MSSLRKTTGAIVFNVRQIAVWINRSRGTRPKLWLFGSEPFLVRSIFWNLPASNRIHHLVTSHCVGANDWLLITFSKKECKTTWQPVLLIEREDGAKLTTNGILMTVRGRLHILFCIRLSVRFACQSDPHPILCPISFPTPIYPYLRNCSRIKFFGKH
jgi:hypothetical protein